jgi:hypothetical protein
MKSEQALDTDPTSYGRDLYQYTFGTGCRKSPPPVPALTTACLAAD